MCCNTFLSFCSLTLETYLVSSSQGENGSPGSKQGHAGAGLVPEMSELEHSRNRALWCFPGDLSRRNLTWDLTGRVIVPRGESPPSVMVVQIVMPLVSCPLVSYSKCF